VGYKSGLDKVRKTGCTESPLQFIETGQNKLRMREKMRLIIF